MATTQNQIFLKINIDGKSSVEVIKNLENQLRLARKELSDLNLTGKDLSATEKQIKKLTDELGKIKSQGSGESISALRKEAILLDLELGQLTKGTSAYNAKLLELANKKDQIQDLGTQIKLLNPDERFKALAQAGVGVVASFTAIQGAMNLLGNDSKEVQEALLKVQSAMLVLESINKVVNSKEAIGLLPRLLGYKSLTAEIKNTAEAQSGVDKANQASIFSFRALKASIAATGIGLLVIAASELIQNWSKVKEIFQSTFPVFTKLGGFIDGIKQDFVGAFYAITGAIKPVGKLIFDYAILPINTLYQSAKILFNTLQHPLDFENWKKGASEFGKLITDTKDKFINDFKDINTEFNKGQDYGKNLEAQRQANARAKELREQEIKDLEQSVQFLKQGSLKRLQVEKSIIDKKLVDAKAGSEDYNKLLVDQFEKGEEIKDKNSETEKKNAEDRQKKLTDAINKIKDGQKTGLESNSDEFGKVESDQNKIEAELEASYARQLASLKLFNEEKKFSLLNKQVEVQSDPKLNFEEKKTALAKINAELLKLDSDYNTDSLQLETELLQNKKNIIQKSEADLLAAKNKQLQDGLKLIEDNQKKEEALINNSGLDVGAKEKAKNKLITDAANEKAELEKKIEAAKNIIIEDGAKKRAANEVEIITNNADKLKDANDELEKNLIEANKVVAEEQNKLLADQQKFKDALVDLYTAVRDRVIELFAEVGTKQTENIDKELQTQSDSLNKNKDSTIQTVQQQYDNGLISKQGFESKKNEIEAQYSNQAVVVKERAEVKKAEVEKKAATIKKGVAIGEIFIDAFKEVSKISALAATARAASIIELANPFTIPLGVAHAAASVAATAQIPFVLGTAAAQAGAVAVRKFADGKSSLYKTSSMSVKDVILFEKMNPGVVTKGTTGRADDVPAFISKDETIINAKSSKIFNKELSYINSFNGYGIKFAADGYGNSSIGSSPVFGSLRGAKNLINAPEERTAGLLEKLIEQNDILISGQNLNNDIGIGLLQKPVLNDEQISSAQQQTAKRESRGRF